MRGRLGNTIENVGERVNVTPPGGGDPVFYTWHHHQDLKHMMLVESDVHTAILHTGGTSLGDIFGNNAEYFDLVTKPEF